MKFNIGYYDVTPKVKIPEFLFITDYFFIDVDFTPFKQARKLNKWFPVGWCAAAGFPGDKPPWKYHFHTSWHAWTGEPDIINIKVRDFSWSHEFGKSQW